MSASLPGNLIYPHSATLRRNTEQPKAGQSPYDGLQANAETVILTNLICNIQIDRTGRPAEAKLPSDPIGLPTMRIFFPSQGMGGPAYGAIQERDVIADNLGKRYQVIVVEWQPIGTQVRAQLLQT